MVRDRELLASRSGEDGEGRRACPAEVGEAARQNERPPGPPEPGLLRRFRLEREDVPGSLHADRLEGTLAEGAGHARREVTEASETRQA